MLSIVVLRLGYRTASGQRMSLLDAAYFTTETLTTVGFGDFYFGSQAVWLRVWAIALMIIGAALVTVLYAMLTNLLVSRRIAQSLGRQVATRMSGHVIPRRPRLGRPARARGADRGRPARRRARARRGQPLPGPRPGPRGARGLRRRHGPGHARVGQRLARARAVAVLTSSDLINIETGLAVDDMLGDRHGTVPIVLRVFDRELAETIDAGFGFHEVRSTAALAAPWFVGAALGLDILTTFYVDRQPMLVGRLTVADRGGLQGAMMSELSARIRVVAIRRRESDGSLEYPPRRDTRFGGGDEAYLVGPYEDLLQVLRRDQVARST